MDTFIIQDHDSQSVTEPSLIGQIENAIIEAINQKKPISQILTGADTVTSNYSITQLKFNLSKII